MEQWLEGAQIRLNSEAFQALVQRIQYEDLTRAHRELADAIGVEMTLKLCETMGGNDLYIPKNRYFFHLTRNQKIFDCRQTGATVAHLAKQFRLSEASIRRILRDAAEAAPYCPINLARMISVIGLENARRLCEAMGGRFYIPNNTQLKIYLRNLAIYDEFHRERCSAVDLAEKYQTAASNVRRIVNTPPENLKPEIGGRKGPQRGTRQ